MPILLLSVLAAFAQPPTTEDPPVAGAAATDGSRFAFKGQPECVTLSWTDGVTMAKNGCAAPLLVDHSVQTGPSIIAPGDTVALRDLSAFSIGLEGELHWVVAVWAEPAPQPPTSPARTLTGRPSIGRGGTRQPAAPPPPD